jgi:hypothetical protein
MKRNLLKILRRLLGIKGTILSTERILDIVRYGCVQRGWPFEEPVMLKEGLRYYRGWTNANFWGGNVTFVIDAMTGKIIRIQFVEY